MNSKRNNQYKLRIEEVALKDGTEAKKTLEFEFENHDNIFEIIQKIKDKNLFENENDNVEFALGLKLFSEVMIKNKNIELF